MRQMLLKIGTILLMIVFMASPAIPSETKVLSKKPGPEKAIALLKEGNKRFVDGKSIHPHMNAARLAQAGSENQGDHAYATVITCSDSRVPVELIFDASKTFS